MSAAVTSVPPRASVGGMDEPGDVYVEIAAPPALARHVERLWVHRFGGPPPPEGRRLLPDGRINLVWLSMTGPRIAGPSQTFLRPPPVDRLIAFGASFWPGAAPYLLRTDAHTLVDAHTSLEDVDPRLARRIDARMAHATTPRAALAAFADELARHLDDVDPPDPVVRAAVRMLDRPAATVADAAVATSVSERELQRRFVRDVGYAPKTLQRVLRFQRFLGHLEAQPVQLAGAAALAGYADQSHLSREAKKLSGLSPKQLIGYRH
jgi:methylphosphotriester-DNA--protein-cysteine methyltransferase